MKVGLFFGTFNPVHNGHVEIVSQLVNKKIFNQIWIVLSPRSPHKNFNLTNKEARLEMLNITFKNYDNVLISDVEFKFSSPNYTIDTLSYLSNKFPNKKFAIIMGSDNYIKINSWRSSQEIQAKYSIYIYPREGFQIKNKNSRMVNYLDLPKIKISSTIIREGIVNKKDIITRYLPRNVYDFIKKNKLY